MEEPELYLHPHGCRHFYRLLNELADLGLQIVYATHERAFVSAGEFEQINIVRKIGAATKVSSGRTLGLTAPRERLRLQSRFNERLNEVFFASCAVLVEGDPDEVATKCSLEAEGLELDKQSVSVIAVGGKDEVAVIGELLVGFGIPTMAVLDEDPGNAQSAATRARVQAAVGMANVFLQQPNLEGVFGLAHKPSRVEAMTLFPGWFTTGTNATPQVYRDLATRIRALP